MRKGRMSWGPLQASEKEDAKVWRLRRKPQRVCVAQTGLARGKTIQRMDDEATIEMEIHEDEEALAFI